MSTEPVQDQSRPGVARFSARCHCGANHWHAVDHGFGSGIGWACIACGTEDRGHPRVGVPERTEEDL